MNAITVPKGRDLGSAEVANEGEGRLRRSPEPVRTDELWLSSTTDRLLSEARGLVMIGYGQRLLIPGRGMSS